MKVIVERLPSGLYKITNQYGSSPNESTIVVGGAASTIIYLCGVVFQDEAHDLPLKIEPKKEKRK